MLNISRLLVVGALAFLTSNSFAVAADPLPSSAQDLQQSLLNQALASTPAHTTVDTPTDLPKSAATAKERMEQAIQAEQADLLMRYAALQWIQAHPEEYEHRFATSEGSNFKIADAVADTQTDSEDQFEITQFGGVFGRGGLGLSRGNLARDGPLFGRDGRGRAPINRRGGWGFGGGRPYGGFGRGW